MTTLRQLLLLSAFELSDEELGEATEVIIQQDVNSFAPGEYEYDVNGTT